MDPKKLSDLELANVLSQAMAQQAQAASVVKALQDELRARIAALPAKESE